MDSLTPTFKVNIEYEEGIKTSEEYEMDENGAIVMNGNYVVKKEENKKKKKNVDFGIVERAKQVLQLDKEISAIKVTLANGFVLIDSEVEKMENDSIQFKNQVKHAVCIPKSKQANGQIKIEADKEILQGAKLQIDYTLKVNNISELDYVSKNYEYYLYGKGYGEDVANQVQLQANKVMDYIDNHLEMDQMNQLGEIVKENKTQLIEQGWYKEESEWLKNTQKILLIKDFQQKLSSQESENHSLKLSKLLSNSTDDEMLYHNNAEIIEVRKNGGASLITIPGNYIESMEKKEYDEDDSTDIIIVPPTGLDNYPMKYWMIIISVLGIVGLGIIIIKKGMDV